jgi:hypothetical protein
MWKAKGPLRRARMWKIASFVTVFAPAYAASRVKPCSIMTTAMITHMITVTTMFMQPIPMPIIRMGLKAHVKYLRANFI